MAGASDRTTLVWFGSVFWFVVHSENLPFPVPESVTARIHSPRP